MKSYKEVVKSYKDIDKEIILNAPEGAMWYNHRNNTYYTYNGEGVVYFSRSGKWSESSAWFDLSKITEEPDGGDLIPLPNIEIPWEATADSVCPVPDGFKVKVSYVDGCNSLISIGSRWNWTNAAHLANSKIVSYKIIDEEYILGVVTVPQELVDHCKSLVEGMKVDLEQPLPNPEDQLINKLKFLQNLANQFPEIRNEAIKFMECELDGYMNRLWKKDNDE